MKSLRGLRLSSSPSFPQRLDFEGAFFLPKEQNSLTSQIPEDFYEYKNPQKIQILIPKKGKKVLRSVFSTFSLNTQMSRVLFWGVWGSVCGVGGGGGWKWILGNKKGWDL
jgi:hypothetical protein